MFEYSVQVTFQLDGHSRCLEVLYFNKPHLLLNFKLRRKAVAGKFQGLAGIVIATIYKTESIFTEPEHEKLSQFSILISYGRQYLLCVRIATHPWQKTLVWIDHGYFDMSQIPGPFATVY